jgi:hypothetical protein
MKSIPPFHCHICQSLTTLCVVSSQRTRSVSFYTYLPKNALPELFILLSSTFNFAFIVIYSMRIVTLLLHGKPLKIFPLKINELTVPLPDLSFLILVLVSLIFNRIIPWSQNWRLDFGTLLCKAKLGGHRFQIFCLVKQFGLLGHFSLLDLDYFRT